MIWPRLFCILIGPKKGEKYIFFPGKKMKNRRFGAFLHSIPGEEGLELSGIHGFLPTRAGLRGFVFWKVSKRQNLSFA